MIYAQDVWSWQQHLRSGGTTPWQEWLGRDRPPAVLPVGWSAPGAAQLELVRRLALEVADPPRSDDWFAALADLVTSRSGPGRGLAQQPLLWPQVTGHGRLGPHRVGAPPVDPAAVPLEELVRVGVGVLTELLLDPGPVVADPGGWSRSWPLATATRRRTTSGSATRGAPRLFTRTPAFVLDGAPVTTSAVRRALGAAGHHEHPARTGVRVVLLAEPFDQALAQAWSARVQRGAPARWAGFVARWSGRRHLPPSMDLPALAGAWASRVGSEQVHVVVVPPDDRNARPAPDQVPAQLAVRATAQALGLPTRSARGTSAMSGAPAPGPASDSAPDPTADPAPDPAGDPAPDLTPGAAAALSPAAVDVARRVNAVLGVRAAPPDHDAALRRLVIGLPEGPARMPLTVPARFQPWARARAERLAEELASGGYPVHGSLGATVPRFLDPPAGLPTRPDVREALEVVLTACLGLARRPGNEGAGGGG